MKVEENGAYVALLEYDNIEGMIIPNEFSKIGNMRLALKTIKVGRQEIVRVLRVDTEKGIFFFQFLFENIFVIL